MDAALSSHTPDEASPRTTAATMASTRRRGATGPRVLTSASASITGEHALEFPVGTLRPDGWTRPMSQLELEVPVPVADERRHVATETTFALRERSEVASRALNVAIATLALVLLSPLLVLLAIAVKLTSPGPVFYTQTRIGLDRRWKGPLGARDSRREQDLGGRPFTIYKFRSMTVDAERSGKAVWATRTDARVTALGKFLRQYRLDEIPQFLNVIKGDMNIVGPRPERPCIFAQLRSDIAEYPVRQRARPGITGWAQINQSYDSCIDDVRNKVRYDLEYLTRQGCAEDLRIMARTLPVMLFKKGGW